jgi:hypothetical protein
MIYTPPDNISKRDRNKKSVFLAGSIEQGKAEDWQSIMAEFFISCDYNVFNPRRKDYDSSWKQEFDNPQFFQQVSWELNALDKADFILLYLVPQTLSPISLYEFGRYSTSGKMAVVCPEGFWRKGNIEVACHKDNIPLFDSLDEFKKFFTTYKKDFEQ